MKVKEGDQVVGVNWSGTVRVIEMLKVDDYAAAKRIIQHMCKTLR